MHSLESLFRVGQFSVKIAVEIFQNVFPGDPAVFDLIEPVFHMRGELEIDDIGEAVLHEFGDDFAEGGRFEVLSFLGNILAPGDGADGRGIRAWAADALFLHGPDQGRFRIPRRRLGEALLLVELPERYALARGKIGQRFFPAGLLVLVRVLIHGGIPRKPKRGMVCLKAVPGAESVDHHVIIDGVCHLACRKPSPDQPVQAVLLGREILFHALRREVHIARADGFVRILRAGLGLIAAGLAVIILVAVKTADKAPGGGHSFLGETKGVGAHICDETDRSLAGDVHAFVELLRNAHRAPRRKPQTSACLLLERGGDERRRRAALALAALDGADLPRRLFHGGNNILHFLFAVKLFFLVRRAVIAGNKAALLPGAVQMGVQIPVFLRSESADLIFAIYDHANGHGLHAARGETAAYLAPEKRAELIANDAVENAARLLRVHQILIDVARIGNALLHDLFCDLIESDPARLFAGDIQKFLEMPADRLALAVRVGCEIHRSGLFGTFFQLVDNVRPRGDRDVFRRKAVFDVHAELALRQIAQVAHGCDDFIVAAEVLFNRPCLGRRLHNDKVLFCLRHNRISSLLQVQRISLSRQGLHCAADGENRHAREHLCRGKAGRSRHLVHMGLTA